MTLPQIARRLAFCMVMALCAACTLPLLLSAPALAQQVGDIGVVNSGDGELNVRAGPSTQNRIEYVLRNGDRVKVLRREGKWGKVSYRTNASGWVYMPLVSFADDASKARYTAGTRALVCNSKSKISNVRYGAGSQDHGVVTSLPNGHEVTVKGRKTSAKGYIYYEIAFRYPGETKRGAGYIYYKSLKLSCNGKTATSSTAKKASSSSSSTTSSAKDGAFTLRNGKCAVIVASRRTAREVQKFFRDMDTHPDNFRKSRIAYLSRNGWYAISIGAVKADDFRSHRRANLIRNSRWMPNDITCSKRTRVVISLTEKEIDAEVRNAAKRRKTYPRMVGPHPTTGYDVALKDSLEADVKKASEDFAKLWSSTHNQYYEGKLVAKTKTIVRPRRSAPKGLEWCQLQIDIDMQQQTEGYVWRTTRGSYHLDAVEIGRTASGLSEEQAEKRRKWATYVFNDLSISVSNDGKMNTGISRATCTSVLEKGFYKLGHREDCPRPSYNSKEDDEIQKRWRAYQKLNLACATSYSLQKVFDEIDTLEKERIDAVVADNAGTEEKLRPALEQHKGKTLRLDEMGLVKADKLAEWSYLQHLYLRKNALSDLGFLAEFDKLTTLDVSDNQISDISVLPDLDALAFVNLANNNITDVSALARVKTLKAVNLKGNPVFDLGPIQHLIDDPEVTVLVD